MKFVSYNSFCLKRRFGIEMEIGSDIPKSVVSKIIQKTSNIKVLTTGYKLSCNNDYWHIKDDSTCGANGKSGPKGIEIVSYVANKDSDIVHIANIARNLFLCGCRVNYNCGLHIHTEVNDFNIEQMGVLLAYFLKIEHWIENMIPPYRINNLYCKSLRKYKKINKKKNWDPKDLFISISPKSLKTFDNPERKVTLNIINYVKFLLDPDFLDKRNTIEFRFPEGTLNYNDIRFWIYFITNFVENCKLKEMPNNILPIKSLDKFLEIVGLNHNKNNFFIFDEVLFETRNWVLQRICSYGNNFSKDQSNKKISYIS